jgi:transcriptional regulator of NAD metabolism
VNRYSIYVADIEPKGFDVFTIEGFVTNKTIDRVFEVLDNDNRREEMLERNYRLGNEYFSYEVLEQRLLNMVHELEIQHCG